MKKLTVLYDPGCRFCRFCREWLEKQPAYLDLEFLPMPSEAVVLRFPLLEHDRDRDELVVISDEGGVYRGDRAWIMCLYALKEYREWALRLTGPRLRPLARYLFRMISSNRTGISRWMGQAIDQEKWVAPAVQSCSVRQDDS